MATSLKLSPQLKARLAVISKEVGQKPHAFMVQAIEQQVERAEHRKRFVDDALAAERDTLESGLAFDADAVHKYLAARARGSKARRPRAKPWPK